MVSNNNKNNNNRAPAEGAGDAAVEPLLELHKQLQQKWSSSRFHDPSANGSGGGGSSSGGNGGGIGGSMSFSQKKRLRVPTAADDGESTSLMDGTFNGAPVRLIKSSSAAAELVSSVHCVGENYRPDSWMGRSCRFHNLCFNTTSKRFAVFQSASQRRFAEQYLSKRVHIHSSTTFVRWGENSQPQTVSLGGINQKWGTGPDGIPRLEWFPDLVTVSEDETDHHHLLSYYQLPDDVVLVPYHSLNGANPGHLVWDDFLPIYTLLAMFRLTSHPLLMMRYVLQDEHPRGLWASCDVRAANAELCRKMTAKFLPLMTGTRYPYKFTTQLEAELLLLRSSAASASDLVCAKHGVAGIGALTDHGVSKSHGWAAADYQQTHNHGRGPMIYEFRNFMIANLGLPVSPVSPVPADSSNSNSNSNSKRHKIVFSIKSSDIPSRSLDFEQQMRWIREHPVLGTRVDVVSRIFKTMSLRQQVELVHDAAVYVTLCGGGAVTATFLPAGAVLIVYYSEDGGAENNKMTHKPALLDWDLLNSMSHVRVHWMPRNSRNDYAVDGAALLHIIQRELDLIESQVLL